MPQLRPTPLCPIHAWRQAGKKDEVPEASAKLRADVLSFVALTPQKLVEKFGVADIVGDL